MIERIGKFILCLVIAPILIALLLIIAVLILALPIVALIYPKVIKINDK